MIGSILMCDRCGESVSRGAIPAATGRETRLARNRGSIRRVRVGRPYWRNSRGEMYAGRLVSDDLCGRCNRPEIIGNATSREVHRAQRYGGVFVPEGMTLCGCGTGAVWTTGRERNAEHIYSTGHASWIIAAEEAKRA